MAHVFASEGDTIEIHGQEFVVVTAETDRTDGTPWALEFKPIVCAACGVNPVDGKDGWEAFCPGCVNQAMRYVLVQSFLEEATPSNVERVIEYDASEHRRSREQGFQYIDLFSSAQDAILSEDPETIDEQVQDVYDAINRRIAQRIMVRNGNA